MRKKFLKVSSLVLSAVMVTSVLPKNVEMYGINGAIVYAEDKLETSNKCGDNAVWQYDENTKVFTISGTGDMYNNCNFAEYDIEKVVVDEGITSIGANTFYKTGIREVVFPSTLKEIGYFAFWGCENLETVTLPAGLVNLGNSVFGDCPALTSITVDAKNNYFSSVDGVLYSKNGEELILYPADKQGIAFSIPETVTEIQNCAFNFNSNLQKLTIPAKVASINSQAFDFSKSLTEITVDENNKVYSDLNGNLYNKEQTKLIKYAIGKMDTSFVIPESVNAVESRAFQNSKALEEVTISAGVEKIGNYAFNNCPSLKGVRVLNPECSLENIFDADAIKSNFVLYAYRNSAAADFSGKYNVAFKEIQESSVRSVSIATMPFKTQYLLGSKFINTGLAIRIDYEDGTSIVRTTGFTVDGFDSSTKGKSTITVTYKGVSAKFDVDIVEKIENETISTGETKIADITKVGEVCSLSFTPAVSGTYEFYADSGNDTVGYIYDVDGNELTSNDDAEDSFDFYISYKLQAGTTYMLVAKYADDYQLGNFPVTVKLQKADEPITDPDETETSTEQSAVETPKEETTAKPKETMAPQTTVKVTKPVRVTSVKVKKLKKRKAKISWKKIKSVSGYQIQYATNKKFTKNKKMVTVKKASVTKKTVKKLTKKKKYYFRVRAYRTVENGKLCGNWSKVKKVKFS